jgi:hypothetical protein
MFNFEKFLNIKSFESMSKELMNRMIYISKLAILIHYTR